MTFIFHYDLELQILKEITPKHINVFNGSILRQIDWSP